MNDALGGKEQTLDLGGRQVKVTVRPVAEQYEVKLAFPININPSDEQTMALHRELSVVDAQGQPLYRKAFTQTNAQGTWQFIVMFTREGTSFGKARVKVGEPVKLIWTLPVEFKELEVPFEMTNIPLVLQ